MKKYMIIAILLFLTAGNKVFPKSPEVRIVYDYLWVYPTELGSFTSYPSTLVSKLNEQKKYGCSTWRLPTNEELQILQANNLAQNSSYYTQGNYYNRNGYSWRVLLVTTKEEENKVTVSERISCAKANRNKYVDLGLPSGTTWYVAATDGKPYHDARYYPELKYYADEYNYTIPSDSQWKELLKYCKQEVVDDGIILTGPSGKAIFLKRSTMPYPTASQCSECDGDYYRHYYGYIVRSGKIQRTHYNSAGEDPVIPIYVYVKK